MNERTVVTFAGRRVLVAGIGASGFAAARALLERDAKVKVTEAADTPHVRAQADVLRALGADVEIGGHDLGSLDADLAVLSPGIPPTAPVVSALRDSAIPVVSEIELAYRLAECDFLAVTGTNGKTTTTTLLAAILETAGRRSVAAGNIGLPLVDAVAQVGRDGVIAVEVSSFQLAFIDDFHPKVAAVLNIAEDHMDWHGTMDAYARAKARITMNQTADDSLVVNQDDDRARAAADGSAAQLVTFSATTDADACVDAGRLVWRGRSVLERDELLLPGRAGTEDALCALACAAAYGIDADAIASALRRFRPLHHRLETVVSADRVTYIDDSKATNPHATLAAVAELTDVVLIAGGRSKGIDLGALAATVPPVIAVVALGEAADEVAAVFKGLVPVDVVADMDAAVRAARARSVPGGSVLLSPGCASLDMYESYAERGEYFARAVGTMLTKEGADGDA